MFMLILEGHYRSLPRRKITAAEYIFMDIIFRSPNEILQLLEISTFLPKGEFTQLCRNREPVAAYAGVRYCRREEAIPMRVTAAEKNRMHISNRLLSYDLNDRRFSTAGFW